MKLTIIRGLPGSGKSTAAKKMGCFHVETDMFCVSNGKYVYDIHTATRRSKMCMRLVRECLAAGADCVVSNTFITKASVDKVVRMVAQYKPTIKIICMTGDYGSTHGVPQFMLDSMANSFVKYPDEILIYNDRG